MESRDDALSAEETLEVERHPAGEDDAAAGKTDRREFLKAGVALAVTSAAGAHLAPEMTSMTSTVAAAQTTGSGGAVTGLLNPQGLNAKAIADLEQKKQLVLNALLGTGIDPQELPAVTVLSLIQQTPTNAVSGLIVRPVDGHYVEEQAALRESCGVDRDIQLNLAATALAGAAL